MTESTTNWDTTNGTLPVNLTPEQFKLIYNALIAVSPSGGSSPTSNLAFGFLDFAGEVEDDADHATQLKMIETAHNEFPNKTGMMESPQKIADMIEVIGLWMSDVDDESVEKVREATDSRLIPVIDAFQR